MHLRALKVADWPLSIVIFRTKFKKKENIHEYFYILNLHTVIWRRLDLIPILFSLAISFLCLANRYLLNGMKH